MRVHRLLIALPVALFCFLASARDSFADWQNPVGVCKDSRGCGGGGGGGNSPTYSGGGSFRWGSAISDNLRDTERSCRGGAFCTLFGGTISILWGAVFDGPYYAVKGVGYGLLYGGKGLYYGGIGVGKGVAYTGRAIGRGIAYPFNRPPKPILPPTTWEQYKHDVLRHQKMLAKADKSNKETHRWCVKHVPLEVSPNRARWEDLCNAGEAVSRAALPPDLLAAASPFVSMEASPPASIPAAAGPIAADPSAEAATQTPAAAVALETSLPPPAKSDDGEAVASLTPAPPAGAALPTPSPSGDSNAPQNPETSHQQAVQIGVAPEKAGLNEIGNSHAPEPPPASFVGGETPVLLSRGSAPNFPSSFGAPEQVGAVLAPDLPPANSEAYAYLSRAAGFVAQRGKDRTRDVVTKTAKKAISAEFGPAVVLINMYNLPETILPKIIKMAKGDLTVEEGDMLSIESVNILYNFGAAPNKALAKIIEKRDAMKGIFAYGANEASDTLSIALGKGIAGLAGEMHANARYPQIPHLKGSTAGRVDAIFHRNLKDLTTADVRQKATYFEDARNEFIQASRALSADENAREIHEP